MDVRSRVLRRILILSSTSLSGGCQGHTKHGTMMTGRKMRAVVFKGWGKIHVPLLEHWENESISKNGTPGKNGLKWTEIFNAVQCSDTFI